MSIRPSISAGLGPKDCRAFLDLPDGKYLKAKLKDYDEFKKQEIFQVSWHLCTICFTEKKGSDFATFRACHHSFCRDCLKSYFEIQIKDGSVHSLNCPHEKCTSVADGVLVKLIVDKDSFMKYDALLLSRTLESMTDIAYCPRSICQCPLLIDPGERMGICPACNFVFCPFCKMAYHGVAPCNLRSEKKQQICNEYMKGDAAMKETLEKRHGKRVLQTLVENSLSEKWLNSNSKNCPHCNASIEKTEGCNKMTCFRCGIFFCWLCLRQLKASNPYSHYSEKGSECFDKLFPEDDDAFDNLDDEWDVEPGEFLDLV